MDFSHFLMHFILFMDFSHFLMHFILHFNFFFLNHVTSCPLIGVTYKLNNLGINLHEVVVL